MSHRLDRLFRPASVAVIGGKAAARVIEQCERLGFQGSIHAVNPIVGELAGRPTVATVEDLPAPPDAAFVAIGRQTAIEAIEALARFGAGGAVCYTAGFAEAGAGALQAALVGAAGSMPVLGPNCHGYVNAADRVALWPDLHGVEPVDAGAAIVTQSGNIAISLTFQDRGLRLTHVITVGNQAALTIEDVVESLLDDARVRAIGVHCETLYEPHRFAELADRGHRSGTPIVVLKTGSSDQGAAMGMSHTASLAGPDHAWEALFDRAGVVRVRSLEDMLETLKLLVDIGPLAGRDVVTMSCSGGEAGLIADRAEHHAIRFPPFKPDHAARVKSHVHELVDVSNPFDYHTFDWANGPALRGCFTEVMRGRFDAIGLVIDVPRPPHDDTDWLVTIDAFIDSQAATGKPAFVLSTLPENLPEAVRRRLLAAGIAPMQGIDATLGALSAAAFLGEAHRRNSSAPLEPARPGERRLLPDEDARRMLVEAGVRLPATSGPVTGSAVATAAHSIGYPVAVKIDGLPHKSDVGGVALGVASESELQTIVAAMKRQGDRFRVEANVGGIVAEVLIAVRSTPPVGCVLTVGAGGTLVELLADVAHFLVPASPDEVRAGLQRLRIGRLLAGYRNLTDVTVDQLVEVIMSVQLLWQVRPELLELEVNPLAITRSEIVALDVLMEVAD